MTYLSKLLIKNVEIISAPDNEKYFLGIDNDTISVISKEMPTGFENAEIICFDRIKFIDIMKDDFELSKIIINSLAIKVRRLYRQSKNSIPIKVEKRVAAKLWKLSRDYGREVEEGTLIDLSITITYLADMFGAPRETISRALKILDNKGLIINKNKKIIIPDREKLIRFFKDI